MQVGEQLEDAGRCGISACERWQAKWGNLGFLGGLGEKQCNIAVQHNKKHNPPFPETVLITQVNKNQTQSLSSSLCCGISVT